MCKSLPYSLFVCIAVLVSGCSRENVQCRETLCEFYAYTENDYYLSKTVLDDEDRKILWHNGDAISLLFGEQNSRFTCDVERDQPSAKFTGNLDVTSATASSILWAIYPYMSDVVLNNDKLTLTVPCHQTAVASSFDPSAMIMISKRSALDNTLFFNHLCGGLRFKVLDEGITEIIFEGHNEEPLAGTVEVTCNDEGKPVVSRYVNPETTVSLSCEEGFKTNTWYYISTLPGSLTKGFSVTLFRKDGRMVLYSNKKSTVKRSVFGQISQLDKGLAFENDWTKCDFVHRSLMLTFPQCFFEDRVESTRIGDVNKIKYYLDGEVEVVQMFMNGPSPTNNISLLEDQLSMYNPDFSLIDYRKFYVDDPSIACVAQETSSLYGTVSGISINSYYDNQPFHQDDLCIDTCLYFKEPGDYKVVALVTYVTGKYSVYSAGYSVEVWNAPDITEKVVSNIIGDDISVGAANTVKYRSFKMENCYKGFPKNVVVYILRTYGDREIVSDGDLGGWYVDNAYSATVGTRAGLPLRMDLNCSIDSLMDYGNL